MPAIFKMVITRPSLNSRFFFEDQIHPDSGTLVYPPTESDYDAYLTSVGEGFIKSYYQEQISYAEIESRQQELKYDVAAEFFLPRDQFSEYQVPVSVSNAKIDATTPFQWGFQGQPPYNPFSLTYTYVMEFDTEEHVQSAYNDIKSVGVFSDIINSSVASNNTNNFFINDVEVFPSQ
jgi:hypothetical protein